jgi:hypothetical protein
MTITDRFLILALAIAATSAACDDQDDPASLAPRSVDQIADAVPAPAGLVPVVFAGWQTELWPFTGNALSGAASDPINLVFPRRDVREIRASLMQLDGNRTAFGMPNAPPFNCVWQDAVGDPQSGYATEGGWTASVIQLECGDFAPMRFHLRLFPAGSSAIANGHFEVVIPGTNEHEVLSWELAEQLVKVDFLRSGLLDGSAPFTATQIITPVPTYRTINPLIYNGLPVALRVLIGGPASNVSAPVGIPNDGRATILNLAGAVAQRADQIDRPLVINFDQAIPKPFCSQGPLDYLRVVGTVQVDQNITTGDGDAFRSQFHAHGTLDVTPVNPLTGAVLGPTYKAVINEQQKNVLMDGRTLVTMMRLQKLIDGATLVGLLNAQAQLGSGGPTASVDVKCVAE